MDETDFSTAFLTSKTPDEVYRAINNVRGWWSEEINGLTDQLDEIFQYHYEDVHICKIKVTSLIPGKMVEWLVMENYFKFTHDKSEWMGTRIVFEITEEHDQTKLKFTHKGLVPEYECFEICKGAWTNYIQHSLHALIDTGEGHPNGIGKPQTEHEKELRSNQ